MKFDALGFLTDENISPKVISFLRLQGSDVLDTKEQKWFGVDDEELIKHAYTQER